MRLEFSGPVWFWKGPAPWYFITVPAKQSAQIKEMESAVTYGWGMIPVNARIGDSEWYTALWPKDGLYVLPLKSVIRKAQRIEEGIKVKAEIELILSNPKAAMGKEWR